MVRDQELGLHRIVTETYTICDGCQSDWRLSQRRPIYHCWLIDGVFGYECYITNMPDTAG